MKRNGNYAPITEHNLKRVFKANARNEHKHKVNDKHCYENIGSYLESNYMVHASSFEISVVAKKQKGIF
jgi:hypothetical protein